MHALTNLLHASASQTLVLTSFLVAFASFGMHSAHAQNNSQALSPEQLRREAESLAKFNKLAAEQENVKGFIVKYKEEHQKKRNNQP